MLIRKIVIWVMIAAWYAPGVFYLVRPEETNAQDHPFYVLFLFLVGFVLWLFGPAIAAQAWKYAERDEYEESATPVIWRVWRTIVVILKGILFTAPPFAWIFFGIYLCYDEYYQDYLIGLGLIAWILGGWWLWHKLASKWTL